MGDACGGIGEAFAAGGSDELGFGGGADDVGLAGGADELSFGGGADELSFGGGADDEGFGGGADEVAFGGGADDVSLGGGADEVSFGGGRELSDCRPPSHSGSSSSVGGARLPRCSPKMTSPTPSADRNPVMSTLLGPPPRARVPAEGPTSSARTAGAVEASDAGAGASRAAFQSFCSAATSSGGRDAAAPVTSAG